MPSDAAFREALDMLMEMSANYGSMSGPALDAARARVLALYAERQGEEYEVVLWRWGQRVWPDTAQITARLVNPMTLGEREAFKPGDRVRVTKVEEET